MDKHTRQLVVTAVALLVVLFVGRVIIDSFYDSGDLRRRISRLRGSLSSGEAAARPSQASLRAAQTRLSELQATLDLLAPRLAYRLVGGESTEEASRRPPEFDVPSGASPDLRYIEILRREQEDLVQGARFIGKSVPPDLGMPVPNPTGLEDVLSALQSLHIVHLVVSAALDANVAAVDDISLPPVSRRRRTESGFLKTHRVEFDFHGSPASVRDTLAALADGDVYLALDDVRIETLDEDGEVLRCRLSAAAVVLDQDVPVVAEELRR